MRYSIIVLSFNKLAVTRACLTAMVQESVLDGPTELIVVDNGSTDGSGRWLEKELPLIGKGADVAVQVIRNATNVGCVRHATRRWHGPAASMWSLPTTTCSPARWIG